MARLWGSKVYHHAMDYRGYDLEQKTLIVGCQVIVTKNGSFVRNGSILKEMKDAMAEAQAYVDSLMDRDS
jgi:hypothetical protein